MASAQYMLAVTATAVTKAITFEKVNGKKITLRFKGVLKSRARSLDFILRAMGSH